MQPTSDGCSGPASAALARASEGVEEPLVRVFMGLTEVAGYYENLAKGLEQLGVACQRVELIGHAFQYAEDGAKADALVSFYRAAVRRRVAASATSVLARAWWIGVEKASLLLILVRAALTCRVFVFSFGTTFFRYWELPLLKLLGKRILYVFHGSDHRPPYLSGVYLNEQDDVSLSACGELSARIKRNLSTIERHADVIVGHHLSAHLHERPFVPALLLGLPFTTTAISASSTMAAASGAVRIVHAPSRPREKGSEKVRAAVSALRAKGFLIEFVELVGQPNRVVLEELSRCDFIVDELYSDSRMAGLATEAAFFGKPAVVGGYARDKDLAIPGALMPEQFPPVHYCNPEDVEGAIETLIVDVPYRLKLGSRAQSFVNSAWTPREVAWRYLQLMTGEVPSHWQYDPKRIRYLRGWGLPESIARSGLRRYIETQGRSALCLADKPELEQALVSFAAGEAVASETGASRT